VITELQAARVRLARKRPYLASALWALTPVKKPGLETMAVDRWWRLYYDPAVASKWSVSEISGVLYHEVLHLIRNHADRMQDCSNTALSNIAADAEINDDLMEEGFELPGSPVTPSSIDQPDGLFAEEHLEALLKNMSKGPAGFGVMQQGEGGESQSGAGSDGEESQAKQAGGGGEKDEIPRPGEGVCGSCATGRPASWEDAAPKLGEPGTPGIGEAEAEIIRGAIARDILESSTGVGDIPAHLKRWADEKLSPKINWRQELAASVRSATTRVCGAVDYTYEWPSRRQGQVGDSRIIMPSMYQPVPSIAVVVDTSGSIDDDMLAQGLAEIGGILKNMGYKDGVSVLSVDACVHECRKVFRPEQVVLSGGGGTDMGAGIKAAAKLKPIPNIVVVLTDGYTPWPEAKPRGIGQAIVVLSTPDGSAPDWAKAIRQEPLGDKYRAAGDVMFDLFQQSSAAPKL